MGPLKNLGVAHQNPKTITEFQGFSYSVVFRLLEKESLTDILLMYSGVLFSIFNITNYYVHRLKAVELTF